MAVGRPLPWDGTVTALFGDRTCTGAVWPGAAEASAGRLRPVGVHPPSGWRAWRAGGAGGTGCLGQVVLPAW